MYAVVSRTLIYEFRIIAFITRLMNLRARDPNDIGDEFLVVSFLFLNDTSAYDYRKFSLMKPFVDFDHTNRKGKVAAFSNTGSVRLAYTYSGSSRCNNKTKEKSPSMKFLKYPQCHLKRRCSEKDKKQLVYYSERLSDVRLFFKLSNNREPDIFSTVR